MRTGRGRSSAAPRLTPTLPARLFAQDLLDQRRARRLARLQVPPAPLAAPRAALRLHHLHLPAAQEQSQHSVRRHGRASVRT